MPPRLMTLAILVFWMATTAWLFQRDIWPRLQSGQPPPFAIDLADEAQQPHVARWSIYRGENKESKIGRARTWVAYRAADDTFELNSEIEKLELRGGAKSVQVPRLFSLYRVTRDGELREMTSDVKVVILGIEIHAQINGQVREQRFWPHCTLETALLGGKQELDIKPVEVSAHGTVLNPLHPVNRLVGLHPGQRWRMPLIDPLADALAAKVADAFSTAALAPRFLNAEVLPAGQMLRWNGQEVPCLVIEYRGDEMTARTWVRQSDGLVLQQEASQQEERLTLLRD